MTDTRVTRRPTLTRADVEALRTYLMSSRRPVGAVLAYCNAILSTDVVGVEHAHVLALLTALDTERRRWALELCMAYGSSAEEYFAKARNLARVGAEALGPDVLAVTALGLALRDDIVMDVLVARPITVLEPDGDRVRIRPTVHESDALPDPTHLPAAPSGRTRAGDPTPAESLQRRVAGLLAVDTLSAWQLKTAMQVPYQDVARALLVLERQGVARRIVDSGHPDLWAVVEPGN